eukprot:4033288-Amphidinium_carterae.3
MGASICLVVGSWVFGLCLHGLQLLEIVPSTTVAVEVGTPALDRPAQPCFISGVGDTHESALLVAEYLKVAVGLIRQWVTLPQLNMAQSLNFHACKHINLLELRAVCNAIRWWGTHARQCSTRFLNLSASV